MSKGIILSGMRPTGKLHIGHLSVLENWAKMQNEYKCFFMVADLHSLTTKFDETDKLPEDTREMVLDWLGAGVDPVKSAIFVQSAVREHAELSLYLGMNIPLSWLERCPTYKDQVVQFGKQGKDITTYGFLGYPLLMAADILLYLSDTVPVGEDQLPHLEMSREIARRFNFLYKTELFPEPKALLGQFPLVPGVDGRKMSKSYGNDIAISAATEDVKKRVNAMITDPNRVRKDDPGNPDVCVVHNYQEIYNNPLLAYIQQACRGAERGCVACKSELFDSLEALLAPLRARRAEYTDNSYAALKKYLLAVKQAKGKKVTALTQERPEDPAAKAFDQFWKQANRQEKETLKKNGGLILADYKQGIISLPEVKAILDARFDLVTLILAKGRERARKEAQLTISKVREAMNLRY